MFVSRGRFAHVDMLTNVESLQISCSCALFYILLSPTVPRGNTASLTKNEKWKVLARSWPWSKTKLHVRINFREALWIKTNLQQHESPHLTHCHIFYSCYKSLQASASFSAGYFDIPLCRLDCCFTKEEARSQTCSLSTFLFLFGLRLMSSDSDWGLRLRFRLHRLLWGSFEVLIKVIIV